MTILCSWCGRDLGVKFPEQSGVTHACCPDCLARELEKLRRARIEGIAPGLGKETA